MCGISLIVDYSQKLDQRTLHSKIKRMVSRQYHRGPDQSGIWLDENKGIAIGHNRLSIIDTSSNGKQPMCCPDNRFIISYNGEIYNYIQLRKELEQAGCTFKTKTDTEVVLFGYKVWGAKVFSKLNGMWGLSIFDRKNMRVIIARDRVGIKPVYFTHSTSNFIVASEIKAILSTALISPAVCPDGLNEYFTFQNIYSHRTLFKDIYMLQPGEILELDITRCTFTINQYWDLEFKTDAKFNEADFCNELKETFIKASERITVGDVAIVASLSGGMDSSSIVATISPIISNINTFTGYFDQRHIEANDRSVNEHSDARIVSQLFNTTHHERVINSNNVIDTLPAIVWHLEDPKVGMCYTFYLLSQLISQYVTVNISGTGGDEIFGGYPWRYQLVSNDLTPEEFSDVYYGYWNRLVPDADKHNFFRSNIIENMDSALPRKHFNTILTNRSDASLLNQAIYFEFKTFLHGMLMVEDKMGMAFSTETRFPFLDNEMINLAARIPDKYKYSNNEAKILLKRSFEGILPKDILYKRKQGFTPPDMSWYRNDLHSYITNLLLGHRSLIGEYINTEYINSVLVKHLSAKEDNRLLIWSLMFFEGWLRTFIAGEGKNEIHF